MIKRIIFYMSIILLLGIAFLIFTPAGLRTSIFFARAFFPGKLNISEIRGSLSRTAYFTNLDYQHNNTEIFVNHTKLELRPWQLLTGRINIKNLHADQIIIKYRKKRIAHIRQMQLQAKIKGHSIVIRQLNFSGSPYSGSLTGSTILARDFQTNLHGQFTASIPDHPLIKAEIKIIGNLTQHMLIQLDVNHSVNAHLTASLTKFFTQGPINVTGHWSNLFIPINISNNITSKSGTIIIDGTLNNYAIHANTDLSGTNIPNSYWQINGTGSTNNLHLSKIKINTLSGEINSNLTLAWQPDVKWYLNLQTTHINPGIKWRRWNGDVNGDVTFDGVLTTKQRKFNLVINNLHGKWRGQTLNGYLKIISDNNKLLIDNSHLQIGNNSMRLSANLNDTWRGQLFIYAPNITRILPHTSGSLLANLQITGTKNSPQIDGSLTAKYLKIFAFHIKRLAANANIKIISQGITNLKLTGQDLDYKYLHYKTFDLNLNGHVNDHTLQTNINTKTGAYTLKLTGKFINSVWRSQIQQFEIQDTHLGTWHLTKIVPITLAQKEFTIAPFCLRSLNTSGKICGEIKRKKQSLAGYLKINLPSLSILSNLIPQVNNLNGRLVLNSKIAGTYAKPSLIGSAKIINGTAQINPLGITLRAIHLTATANRHGKIKLKGRVVSGSGMLEITGTSSFPQKFSPSQLNIRGKNILIANTKDYQITASPQLQLSYYQPEFSITGSITIPHAQISLQNFTQIVTLPDNTVIINGQKTTTPQRYKYSLNLDVALTHEIKINSDNLIAQLTGKLNVKHSPLQPITATGELNITDGTYNAYGQPLKIIKGDLLFTGGPVNNPRLNIQATKTLNIYSRPGTETQFKPDQTFRSIASMQRLTVGVQATGTLQHPKLKLFSQPGGLSDTDILSYMMLGTSSNQATASQTQMLFQTAQLMGIGGTNAAGGLQRIFGLTDFGVEQEEVLLAAGEQPTQEQMFGIGKYITPRLYLHYSIGISNPISILNLTYYLTHQFAIQTQTSSVDRAADIFYTFETN